MTPDRNMSRCSDYSKAIYAWLIGTEKEKRDFVQPLNVQANLANNQRLVDPQRLARHADLMQRTAENLCYIRLYTERNHHPRENEFRKLWNTELGLLDFDWDEIERRLG